MKADSHGRMPSLPSPGSCGGRDGRILASALPCRFGEGRPGAGTQGGRVGLLPQTPEHRDAQVRDRRPPRGQGQGRRMPGVSRVPASVSSKKAPALGVGWTPPSPLHPPSIRFTTLPVPPAPLPSRPARLGRHAGTGGARRTLAEVPARRHPGPANPAPPPSGRRGRTANYLLGRWLAYRRLTGRIRGGCVP